MLAQHGTNQSLPSICVLQIAQSRSYLYLQNAKIMDPILPMRAISVCWAIILGTLEVQEGRK